MLEKCAISRYSEITNLIAQKAGLNRPKNAAWSKKTLKRRKLLVRARLSVTPERVWVRKDRWLGAFCFPASTLNKLMENNDLFESERILKKEGGLRWCGGFFPRVGALVLTPVELYFISFKDKKAFAIPLKNILSVNCKKGFGAGNDNMYVLYKQEGEKQKQIKIQKSSFTNAVTLGNLARLGNLYFASWEQAINQARHGPWYRGGEGIEDIKKLARLRGQGIITEEEFTAKKKQILNL
jgi:hypothetical protein